jgi:hypothetical protein
MELLRVPGREAAAAPTATALSLCQQLRRLALTAANRAVPGAAAGPSCTAKASRAAHSSFKILCAHCGAMRTRSSPGCRALGPALRDVQTPTLPGADRQAQRDRAPKLEFRITMVTVGARWARQRRLEPLQCSENPRQRFARVAVATLLAVGACSADALGSSTTAVMGARRALGPVRGLVFGQNGEGSADVHALLRAAAKSAALTEGRQHGAPSGTIPRLTALFESQLRRAWGVTVVRDMARHRLIRLPHIGVPRGTRMTPSVALSAYAASWDVRPVPIGSPGVHTSQQSWCKNSKTLSHCSTRNTSASVLFHW